MGQKTLDAMRENYGTSPEEVIACIGPSICRDCFEVGGEVVEEFRKEFDKSWHDSLFYQKENGKYQLDLWKANEIVLLDAGVKKDHLEVTDVCTCCNPELLFSHRASHGKRGNLGAFLCLNP